MPELLLSLGRILVLLLIVYAAGVVWSHFASPGMIFPRPPTTYELTPDYVQLTTPDGVKLAARYWPNPTAKYTMLYLHGNYEQLGALSETLPQFVAAGYAVFAVDYRGYGRSEGTASEAGLYIDVQAAYDHVRTKLGVPANRIVIFGYSLGGGPGVELALQQPVAGLVLQGPFISTYRILTRIPLFPGDKFVNIRKVPKLKLPVFVIHGMADEVVPFWHGERIYAAITARKTKLFIPGGPHNGLSEFAGPVYWQELKKFTDSL